MKIKKIFQGAVFVLLAMMMVLFFSISAGFSHSLLLDYQNNSRVWFYVVILGSLGLVLLFSLNFLNKKWKLGIKSEGENFGV